MLVVVLIIGILAAVALPQYQKAVVKARYSQLFAIMNGVAREAQLAFLEGAFPSNGDQDYDICKNFESFQGGSWGGEGKEPDSYYIKDFEINVQTCKKDTLYFDTYRQPSYGNSQNIEFHFYPDGTKHIWCGSDQLDGSFICPMLKSMYGEDIVDD